MKSKAADRISSSSIEIKLSRYFILCVLSFLWLVFESVDTGWGEGEGKYFWPFRTNGRFVYLYEIERQSTLYNLVNFQNMKEGFAGKSVCVDLFSLLIAISHA